ncbi:MAG: adenylate/guanylate cyclase domain-containing protein [Thermodesulfobacteriota bacterium]
MVPKASIIRRLKLVPVFHFAVNILGALLTFFYFTAVERVFFVDRYSGSLFGVFKLFVCMWLIVVPTAHVSALRSFYALVPRIRERFDTAPVEELRELAGRIMNLPLKFVLLSSIGWLCGGLIFGFTPKWLQGLFAFRLEPSLRLFFGIVCVGAPLTLFFNFFLLEWLTRDTIRKYFPSEALLTVPPSMRINVLPKMFAVSLMIGTLPVSVMSYITIHQICEVQAGRQAISSFLSQMPVVIVFLLAVAVWTATFLSISISRSVSFPLRKAADTMDLLGQGDLTVRIPVISNDEIGVMAAGFNRMAEGLQERDHIRATFGRYLSADVVTEILKSPDKPNTGGELLDITVVVTDLRGFTRLTRALEARLVLEVLNRYLETMTDVILAHEGTIDEFTGDGILVFFGAPRRVPDHQHRAVRCALAMQAAMDLVNEGNLQRGLPRLEMGIGINSGQLVVGNIGSEKRFKYGAVGDPINVAFRIQSEAEGGEILVAPAVHKALAGCLHVINDREVLLKGLDEPLRVCRVIGINA